ncbi:MAG: sigma-70 family RNA polymerase sigma factor [Egibacteraceae bacterium]
MRHVDRGTTEQGQRVEALLSRLAAGDQAAFAVLYEQVAGQVYGLVNQILGCSSQSEEVATEILLEVWRAAPRYDPSRGSGRVWILAIAHRWAVDQVRREHDARDRRAVVALQDNGRFDAVAEVRAAFDQLTAAQRETVELAYYGGYTYPEVAELLDAPLDTVTSRMRDGLIHLRGVLGPEVVAASH